MAETPAQTKARMAKAVANPQDQANLRRITDWFVNTKPQIDRRADKNKKTHSCPSC